MSNMAILGHATRGKEVIEILEMLGGKNAFLHYGDTSRSVYYIDKSNRDYIIRSYVTEDCDYVIFTLEEFLEKFPYKVGDKVSSKYLKNYKIEKMEWEDINNRVIYKLQGMSWYSANELRPYKEETMDEVSKFVFDANAQCCDIMNRLIKKETMEEKGTLVQIDLTRELCVADEVEVILGDYEFVLKDGKTYFVKKKPQYPKTYEECCEVLDWNPINYDRTGYKFDLLCKLQVLLICRDAYWKIAGEQMGLGEPWNPDWLNTEQDKFVLYTHNNAICLNRFVLGHNVIAFPTAEMREAFYENFKDLIESVKELL